MSVYALNGRVGVKGSDNNLELRVDTSLLLGIGTDERDGTDTFTVKTEVLSLASSRCPGCVI